VIALPCARTPTPATAAGSDRSARTAWSVSHRAPVPRRQAAHRAALHPRPFARRSDRAEGPRRCTARRARRGQQPWTGTRHRSPARSAVARVPPVARRSVG
jgi:hypothetical protein